MSAKPQVPAIDGWHTMAAKPHLIGTQCEQCGTYFFPKQSDYCRNPSCDSTDFREVELSRTGTLLGQHSSVPMSRGHRPAGDTRGRPLPTRALGPQNRSFPVMGWKWSAGSWKGCKAGWDSKGN